MTESIDTNIEKKLLIHFLSVGKCTHCEWFLCDCAEHNWQWFDLLHNMEKFFNKNPSLRPKNANKYKIQYCTEYTEEFITYANHIRKILYDLSLYTYDDAINGLDISEQKNVRTVTNEYNNTITMTMINTKYDKKYIVHDNDKTYYRHPYSNLLLECNCFKQMG